MTISDERKAIYEAGKLLKMTSDKVENSSKQIEKLALVFTYNAFSAPKDRIDEAGFTKRRCKPAMIADQIKEATKRANELIGKIRDIEKTAKAQLPAILDLDYKRIAGIIRARHNVLSFGGVLFRYTDGVYVRDYTGLLNSEIVKELSGCSKFEADDDITRAANQVKHYLTHEIVEAEYPFNLRKDAFNVANGIILINVETGEHQLIPHSPEYKFNYKLKVKYDANAPVEGILKYFETLESPDNPIRDLLVQIPAHALLSMNGRVYKRAYYLKGDHDSGKSTLIEMFVDRFFGDAVCSSISLHDLLCDRFRIAELDGKLFNVYADLPSTRLGNVGLFKALTGGDKVTVERKHQDPYQLRNRAVLLFSGNQYPCISVKDDEDAFWVRWIPIEFHNSFSIDPAFADKVFTEQNMSGLLNLVLMQMPKILVAGLMENGNIMAAWLRDSNSAHEYIENNLEKCTDAVLIKSKIYQEYTDYCRANELTIEEQKSFTQSMRAAGYIVDSQVRIRGERQHVYTDCKLKTAEFALYPDEKLKGIQSNITVAQVAQGK